MPNRIPNTNSPSEVRQAFQRLTNSLSNVDISDDTNLAVVSPIVLTDDTLSLNQGAVDHGSIGGLSDDDHTQYHNDARGDARYYTEIELDAGQLDSRYYTETELDAGQLDNRYYTETEIDAAYGPYEAEADSDIVIGKVLYVVSDGHVDLAANDSSVYAHAIGIAATAVSAGASVEYVTEGRVYLANWSVIIGSSLLTPGTEYYLKEETGGGAGAPSYGNTGGTGDRTGIITVTSNTTYSIRDPNDMVDGTQDDEFWWTVEATAGKYIRFDFGSGTQMLITEAKWYQDTNYSHGTWKWQGSNNASDWDDIGSSFTLGGVVTQTQTELSGNTTQYRYYQLLGVSGNLANLPYLREIEFEISLYVDGTKGQLTATPTSTLGSYIVRVGRAVSTTVLDIEIERPILL